MDPRLSRRRFLSSAAAVIGLPYLASVVERDVVAAASCAGTQRFIAFFVPNGIHMPDFTPATAGKDWAMPYILQPLEPIRSKIAVVTGIDYHHTAQPAEPPGGHGSGTGAFLTMMPVNGNDKNPNRISLDQKIAKSMAGCGRALPSLQLGLKVRGDGSDHTPNLAFIETISWDANKPLPFVDDPQENFDRIFEGVENAEFVLLGDLPGRRIELEPVPVSRDVAAGDHDGRAAFRHGMERQRRRRQRAAIDRHQPGRPNRRGTVGRNRRARRAKIAADEHPAASGLPARLEMRQKRRRVASRRRARQRGRQPTQPAGAELQCIRHAKTTSCRIRSMPIGKDSLRPRRHPRNMIIQKRTMNWLPRAGIYDEMQANRAKRQQANEMVNANMARASSMLSVGVSASEDAYNLTLRIAATRVQQGINVRPKSTKG